MYSITILFFASLRDITGEKKILKEIPPDIRIGELKNLLLDTYPGLHNYMESMIVALNHEHAGDDTIIPDGSEVAVFPPVSGGKE